MINLKYDFPFDCTSTLDKLRWKQHSQLMTNWTIWLQELAPQLIDCSIARRLLSLDLLQFHTVVGSEQRLDRCFFTRQCIPSKSIHFNFKTLGTSSPSYCASASNEGLSIVFHWTAFHQKFSLFLYKGIVVHSWDFDVSMCNLTRWLNNYAIVPKDLAS